MNHFLIDQALNLSANKTPAENWTELRPLWEDLPQSAQKRHALNKAVGAQTMEFRHHNVEFGYTYSPAASTAVVDDGSPPYVPLDPIRLYEPSTQPGHPLPHAWVEREGERIALGTLAYHGQFLLIAGEDGQEWVAAAERLAAAGAPAAPRHPGRRHRRRLCRCPLLLAQATRHISRRRGAGPARPLHRLSVTARRG